MIWDIFEMAAYMPHGMCLLWLPSLVALHAGSDTLIFVSYSAIPFALISFLRKRPDLNYRGLVGLFAAFILLCGVTHLVSIVTLWYPLYVLQGWLKLATGLVSTATAFVLFRLIPMLAKVPSPAQLTEVNTDLKAEIAAHETTFEELRESQRDLESKVAARTVQLEEANERLEIMAREAVHRSRNLLAVVSSIARQTAYGSDSLDEFRDRLAGRIDALSLATSAIVREGSGDEIGLETVVRAQLAPVLETYVERVEIAGEPVRVDIEAAEQLSLVVHELATNAQKFGGLSTEKGTVRITWSLDGIDGFRFEWIETAVPHRQDADTNRPPGYGSALLLRAVPAMLNARAAREIGNGRLVYTLVGRPNGLIPVPPTSDGGKARDGDPAGKSFAVT